MTTFSYKGIERGAASITEHKHQHKTTRPFSNVRSSF